MMQKIKLALLAGGISGEREVSLNTGKQIFNALDKDKYQISRYDPEMDLERFASDAFAGKFDIVFPALHGPFGEDGKLQGMLDMIGVPYVFSGCLASALAMNKAKAKTIVKAAGIKVANSLILEKGNLIEYKKDLERINFPVVIKPIELGSSVGMSIAKNAKELEDGVNLAFKHDTVIMLEEYISGRELTVSVMGTTKPSALPVIEIIPKNSDWFDYEAKYVAGACEEICPAKIIDDIRNELQAQAIKVFKEIGCKDLARADFIWDNMNDEIYFLEINTIPGMTATSLAPQSAKEAGMEFPDFLDKLIEGVLVK
ncbi:D-alanine--D-alanine ligase [bacterium]|nr:D-alanine--D-alanine ligase [bacterium]MBT6753726.1 D-alanine--D-alanine ligase [bacterium]MBT7992595.1 D-alanine--D-alanine ligase [bacterium]